MTVETFRDMRSCNTCEWYNPYDFDADCGECWRYPDHTKVIDTWQCGEYKKSHRLLEKTDKEPQVMEDALETYRRNPVDVMFNIAMCLFLVVSLLFVWVFR